MGIVQPVIAVVSWLLTLLLTAMAIIREKEVGAVNVWYLLRFNMNDGKPESVYHLENPYPKRQQLVLDKNRPDQL